MDFWIMEFHYYMARFFSKLFNYHADKFQEMNLKLDWGNEDDRD